MEYFWNILHFIRIHFFYDVRSSVLSICFLLVIYFMNKLWHDKGEKPIESIKLLFETILPFAIILIIY